MINDGRLLPSRRLLTCASCVFSVDAADGVRLGASQLGGLSSANAADGVLLRASQLGCSGRGPIKFCDPLHRLRRANLSVTDLVNHDIFGFTLARHCRLGAGEASQLVSPKASS